MPCEWAGLLPANANWYDVVVGGALLYGIWSGRRAGLSGELIRTLGLALMLLLALQFYLPLGDWLHGRFGWAEQPARLVGFVAIALATYAVAVLIERLLRRRRAHRPWRALVENVGGAVGGLVRMSILMVLLTVGLCLMRSPFWHEQIAQKSRFGRWLVGQLPAVQRVTEQPFEEKLWFLQPIRRRSEPSVEPATSGPAS